MLIESDRKVQARAVLGARGMAYKPPPVRETLFARLIDKNYVEYEDGSEGKDIFDILRRCIGRDVYISDKESLLTDILIEGGFAGSLLHYGKARIGDYLFSLRNRDWSFFSVRSGNKWGSLYAIDWNVSPAGLRESVMEAISSFGRCGWVVSRVSPPIKMFEQLVRDKVNFRDFVDISNGGIDGIHLQRAWSCFRGGRMEAGKLGTYENVFDFDLNAAYFSVLRELPDLRPGFVKWIDSKEYISDAIFGFCKCRVVIDDYAPIGPVAVRVEIAGRPVRLFYPVGESISWRTKDEIDLIRRSGLGEVEILEGSWAISVRDPPRLFAGASRVLERAMDDRNSREIAKYMASISWGKFASVGSPLWNPVYAAFITSRIRARVTEMALLMPDYVIAITVDGLLSSKSLPEEMVSDEIGKLKVRKYGRMMSLADYYRYDPDGSREGFTWEVKEDGIIVRSRHPIEGRAQARVPFGSTKRVSPRDLNLSTLVEGQFGLIPPTPEEVLELYLTTKEFEEVV